MKINAEDGGERKFIMITLPEPTYKINMNGIKVPTKGVYLHLMLVLIQLMKSQESV